MIFVTTKELNSQVFPNLSLIFVTTKELNSQVFPNLSLGAFKSWSQLLPGRKTP
ncbi:MAG: hypothetical protein F6K17_22035 [Okeania sp. SIO3C4]|nr:hypothetical protein [Okeania sp. SIO3B3]NER05078.1 hypothetical protein [Okeania sp. SIO3C4]